MVPLDQRLQAAQVAASLGRLLLALAGRDLQPARSTRPIRPSRRLRSAARLRIACVAGDPNERMNAMRGLWDENVPARTATPALILTASAAARIAPSGRSLGDRGRPHRLDADRRARPRGGALGRGGRAGGAGATAPGPCSRSARRGRWSATGSTPSSRPTTAPATSARCCSPPRSPGSAGSMPTRPRARASPRRRRSAGRGRSTRRRANITPGAVALLAGVGMQTWSWRGVPAPYLFRSSRDLRLVGLEYEARMIAAEAMAGCDRPRERSRQCRRRCNRGLPRNDGGRSRRGAQHPACL